MLEMAQLPLVIFTLLSQMAVGGILCLLLLDKGSDNSSLIKKGNLFVFGITVLSIIASLFHLGHPFLAFRALTHVSTSWLSREVVVFGVFALLVLAYAYLAQKESPARKGIGILAGLVGILGIAFSGELYLLPTHPGWDHYTTILFFYSTVLLVGPVVLLAYLQSTLKKEIPVLRSLAIKSMFVGALLLAISIALSLNYQMNGSPEAMASANLKLGSYLVFFILQLVLSIGGAIVGALMMSKRSNVNLAQVETAATSQVFKNPAIVFALLIVIGEICGRLLFYLSAVSMVVGNGMGVIN